MSTLPTYSVVIPCYNVAEWVGEAIESALRQTLPAEEIICVDDGSTDGTLGVVRAYEAQYETLHVIAQENAGAPAARNRGLAVSSGVWIQFLDADDVIAPEKVEADLARLQGSGADVLCGSFRRVEPQATREITAGVSTDDWVNLVSGRCGITSPNLWRRTAVESIGGWRVDCRSSQEYDLLFRLLQTGHGLVYSSAMNTLVRARPGSVSDGFSLETRKRYLDLRIDIANYLEGEGKLTGQRRSEVHNAIFKIIRGLYPLDPEGALEYLEQALPSDFVPRVNGFNRRSFVWAYRLLGLNGAERLRTLAGRTQY